MAETPSHTEESIRVFPIIGMMIEQLSTIAWVKLGLQPDPISRKIEKDTAEAKAAIDAIAALIPILEQALDADDQRQLQSLLRDVRINYVQHSGGGE